MRVTLKRRLSDLDAPSKIQGLLTILAFTALSFFVTRATPWFSRFLLAEPGAVSVTAGFGVAALALAGSRYWLCLFFGSLAAQSYLGHAPAESLVLAFSGSLEALIGVSLLRIAPWYIERAPQTETVSFIAVAVIAPILSASAQAFSFLWIPNGVAHSIFYTWLSAWAAHALGILVFAPTLLLIKNTRNFSISRKQVEGCFVSVLLFGAFSFWFSKTDLHDAIFIAYPMLLLVAVRYGEWVKLLSAAMALFCVNFLIHNSHLQILDLQLFLGSIIISALAFLGIRKAGAIRYPALALIFVWAIIVGLNNYISRLETTRDREHILQLSKQIKSAFQDNTKDLEKLLRGARGLFKATGYINREQWLAYVKSLQIRESHPEVRGMGVVIPISRSLTKAFTKRMRQEGQKDFQVHNITINAIANYDSKAWPRFVVSYVDPSGLNQDAIGVDIGSETARRHAAQVSRDTGDTVLSSVILKEGDPDYLRQLILIPIYKTNSTLSSIDQRRSFLWAWIYAPLDVHLLFDRILKPFQNELEISVFDISSDGLRLPIYESKKHHSKIQVFEQSVPFDFGKHSFSIEINRSSGFTSEKDVVCSLIIFLGSIIGLMAATLIGTLQSLQVRARQIAGEKLNILATNEQKILALNESLESRVLDRTRELAEANNEQKILLEERARLLTLEKTAREQQVALVDELSIALKNIEDFKLGLGKTSIIAVTDAHGKILEVNDKFCEISKYSREELIGKDHRLINSKHHSKEFMKDLWKTIKSGKTWAGEIKNRAKNGTFYWVSTVIVPLLDSENKPYQFIAIRTDITEKKEAEQKMRSMESEFQAVLDNSPAAIFVKDVEGRFIMANKKFESLFKFDRNHDLGLTSSEVWPAEIASRIRDDDLKVIQSRELVRTEETFSHADGLHTYMSVKFPIFDANGNVRAVGSIATDITERKRAEEERSQFEVRERSALEASKLKSEFLANMSHEIRTPINGIVGMTKLLAETNLDEEQRGFANALEKSSKVLLTLVNDILDLSKVESGKLEMEVVPFDLRNLIQDTAESFEPLAFARKIGFKVTTDFRGGRVFKGDSSRIRQILNNLIGNALKFTSEGEIGLHVVTSIVERDIRRLDFSVTDTGIGIPPESSARLFQNFTQGDSSTARKFGGTGLGLAICRRLTELMSGAIWVKSTEGIGSEFMFYVQLELANEESLQEFKKQSSRNIVQVMPTSERKRFRVLLAEDNSINQEIVMKALAKSGYRADCVANGREVLTSVETINYDLILMDCQMPEVDGYTASRELRAKGSRIPIVALTANAYKQDQEACLAAGMSDYLSKPVDLEFLIQVIDHWLFSGTAGSQLRNGPEDRAVNSKSDHVIDPTALQRIKFLDEHGEKKLLKKLVTMYLNSMPEEIQKLRHLFSESDGKSISKQAHAMKSSNANLGARRVVAILQKIEDGNYTRDEIPELSHQLEVELDLAKQELSSIKG